MIIGRLNGGLGNQLFVYAATYAFAKDNNESFKIFKFEYDTIYRGFGWELNTIKGTKFCSYYCGIPMKLYVNTIRNFINKIMSKIAKKKIKYKDCDNINYVREEGPRFENPKSFQKNKVNLVCGYWQSPLYFDKYRNDLLRFFVPSFKLSKNGRALLKHIEADDNSVSIHVRRGDYTKLGWCLNLDYYLKAIAVVKDKNKTPNFYVFSDDIDWCKKELLFLKNENVVYVEHKRKVHPFEDIWLMSKCRNNIIANSSFSWWGAYLNNWKDRVVVAPRKMKETNNKDFSAKDWHII